MKTFEEWLNEKLEESREILGEIGSGDVDFYKVRTEYRLLVKVKNAYELEKSYYGVL